MKQVITKPAALPYSSLFAWVRQATEPVWGTVLTGEGASRVEAVGTATKGSVFLAWTSTGPLRVGGVSTTLAAGDSIAVFTDPPA